MKTTRRFAARALAALGLIALFLAMPPTTLAKRQKRTVSATVGGKHVGWKGRFVIIHETAWSGLTVIATKAFATKTIGVGCGILLAGQTFPLETNACSLNYQTRKGRHIQGWLN